MEQKREVERDIHKERVREREGNREQDKYTQFGREASTDHPLGEGLG